MQYSELHYRLALHALQGVSSPRMFALMEHYGTAEAAWQQVGQWNRVLRLHDRERQKLELAHRAFDIEEYYRQYQASGARVICADAEEYDNAFTQLFDPPYLYFCLGEMPQSTDVRLAIIGSRSCTKYGEDVAFAFGRDLAAAGYWVISGMARGLDTQGHLGALAARGKTVAVLGSGIDVIYPPESVKLYHDISGSGAVISEFPLGTPPNKGNFPLRNRLISALAQGIVVVEAGETSGTQITVGQGLEQGKEIFAVPGPVQSAVSVGTHAMIRQGSARLVTCAQDVIDDLGYPTNYRFGYKAEVVQADVDITPEWQLARGMLSIPCHVNDLAREMGLPMAELLAHLSVWEMRGQVDQLPGQYIVLSKQTK